MSSEVNGESSNETSNISEFTSITDPSQREALFRKLFCTITEEADRKMQSVNSFHEKIKLILVKHPKDSSFHKKSPAVHDMHVLGKIQCEFYEKVVKHLQKLSRQRIHTPYDDSKGEVQYKHGVVNLRYINRLTDKALAWEKTLGDMMEHTCKDTKDTKEVKIKSISEESSNYFILVELSTETAKQAHLMEEKMFAKIEGEIQALQADVNFGNVLSKIQKPLEKAKTANKYNRTHMNDLTRRLIKEKKKSLRTMIKLKWPDELSRYLLRFNERESALDDIRGQIKTFKASKSIDDLLDSF